MIRRPSPTAIIASVALFFSIAGTGIAASRYLITSTSQIAPSVRHALQGQRGPQGSVGQGLQGPAGLTGSAGVTGPQGPVGLRGPQGSPGAQGGQGVAGTVDWSTAYYLHETHNLTTADPSTTLTVSCLTGDHALQGGFAGNGEIVTGTGSVAARQWLVIAHLDPSATVGYVSDWVLCVR